MPPSGATATGQTTEGRYLTVRLGPGEYGIPVSQVREIVGLMGTTNVPNMPAQVIGVVNLRGKVIPVIDLAKKLSVTRYPDSARTCVVIITLGNNASLGLIVDAVQEVLRIQREEYDPSPSGQSEDTGVIGLARIKGQVKVLLDVQRVLQDELDSVTHLLR